MEVERPRQRHTFVSRIHPRLSWNTSMPLLQTPEFGTPYNDIGSYVIKLGKFHQATPWLKHASATKRYGPCHLPHVNSGRIYCMKVDSLGAPRKFGIALEIEPRPRMARRLFAALSGQLN